MTARMVTLLVLRVLGLIYLTWTFSAILEWVTLRVLRTDPTFVGTALDSVTEATTLVYIGITGAFGLACLFNTATLSRWLFPEFREAPAGAAGLELQGIGFAVVGVAVAAYAAPDVITALLDVLWHLGGERRQTFAEVMRGRWLGYVRAVGALVVGVAIYKSSSRLASRLNRQGEVSAS